MNFIRTIFGFILAITLVAFAVSNRQSAELVYSPVHDTLDVPLYLIALLFMALGFVLGGFAVWINGGKTRRLKRQQRKTIKELEKELKNVENTDAKTTTPPSDFFPALPHSKDKDDHKKSALPATKN